MEKEFKLGIVNSQLKLNANEKVYNSVKVIGFLCKSLKIEICKQESRTNTDIYYDTKDLDINSDTCSLRIRNEIRAGVNLPTIATVKKPCTDNQNSEIIQSLDREEIDIEIHETRQTLKSKISEIAKLHFSTIPNIDRVSDVVTIKNERQVFLLSDGTIGAELCLDKFYFFSDNRYSRKLYQIELEIDKKSKISNNSSFYLLLEGLMAIFDLNNQKKSKYNLAMSWKNNPEEHINITSIMIDVVGYSTRTNEIQEQTVLHLNKIVKDTIRELQDKDIINSIVYIPTGDGMIIVSEKIDSTVNLLVRDIQLNINKENKNRPETHKYNIRIGVHYGPVFLYTDIRENDNFAGNGINMVERVCSLGNKNHILFSKEAYDKLNNKSNFNNCGSIQTKNEDVSVSVYNYYSDVDKFGNPNNNIK